ERMCTVSGGVGGSSGGGGGSWLGSCTAWSTCIALICVHTAVRSRNVMKTDTHESLRIGSEVRAAVHVRDRDNGADVRVHAEVDACASASAAFWKMRRFPSTRLS